MSFIDTFVSLFSFQFISQQFSFILFLAIITLALTVVLKSMKLFIAQFTLLVSLSLLHAEMTMILPILISIVQVILSAFILYRLKKAVDRNYQLVMEKTHQQRPDITKNTNGTQRSFL
jgi:membrane protein implicated in regulation of membrane protease activity